MLQSPFKNKRAILTQNNFLVERKFKLRWLLLASVLPLLGAYAAFGTAPDTTTQDIAVKEIIEEIALPTSLNKEEANLSFLQIDNVRRDDTLASLLNRLNIHDNEAIQFLRTSHDAQIFSSHLIPNRNIEAQTTMDGQLLKLEYELDDDAVLQVHATEHGFQVSTQALSLDKQLMIKSAKITSSLFGATEAADIPDRIALQLADIFASEIDFNEDIRKGDTMNVVYEAYYHEGNLIKTGKILAAEFINNGKTYKAIHFGNGESKYHYYTPEGKSIHKAFLRSPLEFSRISSGFSAARFHPVLQRMRAHKGVDFAAPTGTGVKASGNAIVSFVGVKGGYGNVIILKHENKVSTVYGHLSRFAKGLRIGSRIEQGQLIGYVGMTGLASGPHLHYEFLQADVHKDPMKVALPTQIPLSSALKPAFDKVRDEMMSKLDLLHATNIASSN